MSIYDGTSKAALRRTAVEARARIQDALRLLDEGEWEDAKEAAMEAAGLAGNFEGEVEAYAEAHLADDMQEVQS